MASRRRSLVMACGTALLCALLSSSPAAAQSTLSVFPADPPDRAVVRSRPVFQIRYTGIEADESRSMRLRIVLSADGFRGESYVFDQRASRSGWALGEEGVSVYLPRRPIEDGSYAWAVWYWNGVEWVGGEPTFRLRVDTVPPAQIADLSPSYDRELQRLGLRWSPVTLDSRGDPEYVARYRVYRYAAPPFLQIPANEVALSESESIWLDEPATNGDLVFFSVAAEDQAGNRAGQRHATEP